VEEAARGGRREALIAMADWISWAPAGAATLHIVEEFVFPGGFAEWDRRYRPEYRESITPRLHIVVNGLLLLFCANVGTLGLTPVGVAAWLTLTALLTGNAVWHLIGAVRTKSYSPGMVTGLLLYLPLAIYGYARFLRAGLATVPTAIVAAVLGVGYTAWVSGALHRWRKRH
jgi:hypothetical protein